MHATECDSEFDDPGSKAYLASVVFQGQVVAKSRVKNGRYNVTFNVNELLHGELSSFSSHGLYDQVVVRQFADVANAEACVGSVRSGERLVVYLGSTDNVGRPPVYTISALPDVDTRQAVAVIRDTVCPRCGKYYYY